MNSFISLKNEIIATILINRIIYSYIIYYNFYYTKYTFCSPINYHFWILYFQKHHLLPTYHLNLIYKPISNLIYFYLSINNDHSILYYYLLFIITIFIIYTHSTRLNNNQSTSTQLIFHYTFKQAYKWVYNYTHHLSKLYLYNININTAANCFDNIHSSHLILFKFYMELIIYGKILKIIVYWQKGQLFRKLHWFRYTSILNAHLILCYVFTEEY